MPAEIFYVEDNPAEVFLLQEAVRALNENVRLVTADDGKVALSLLMSKRVQPAVIVLDLHIPGIDGFAVLKAVKSHPELKTVPTVIFAERTDRKQIETAGCAPELFLIKPMDLDGYIGVAEQIIALCSSTNAL
jgi:CheY-like chemotaxis protein